MRFLKKYNSIKGYLHRFTLLKIGELHIRTHEILKPDETPFVHNHPFKYLSIIYSGGYDEQVEVNGQIIEKSHKAPAFILRDENTYHRIIRVKPNTKTLFCAYGNSGWKLKPLDSTMKRPEDGLYIRTVNGKEVFAKCKDGMYFIGSENKNKALQETRPSIYQVDNTEPIKQ